ncbi:MAG: NHL repeat-containing protein, partial [Geitlerinemataceae cyanobacterium]
FRTLLQTTGVTINDGDDEDDNVVNTGADYKRVDVLALAEAIVALAETPPPEPSDLVRYDFTYYYDGYTTENDYYTGYMYGAPGELQVGTLYDIVRPDIDNEAGFDGLYYITDARIADSNAYKGDVFVTQYYDVDYSGNSYTPYYFQNGEASGFNGIGSEYDFVVANGNFDDFGRDFAQADASRVSSGDGGGGGAVSGLFVSSEYNDRILRFDAETGDFIEVFVPTGSGGLGAPLGLTFGPDDNLYVSSAITDEVLRYDGETGDFIDVFASGGNLEEPDYLAFGPDGNLYVSSPINDRVLRYDGTTGDFIDVFASGGGLAIPDGLTFGPDGDLYVTSSFTDEILRYDGDTGDYMGVFASGGGLEYGDGITFGPDGNLYVSNLYTDEVLYYDGITGDFIDAFVPEGYGGLDEPTGVTFGSDGNLYVSSNYTDEILRYDGITGEFIDVFAYSRSLESPVGLAFVD